MPSLLPFHRRPAPVQGLALQPAPASPFAPYPAVSGPVAQVRSGAVQGVRFQYPLRLWLSLRLAGYALIALALVNLVQAFARVIALFGAFGLYELLLLISALACLLFSVATGVVIAGALPSLTVGPDGLAVSGLLRTRLLPWGRIARLHSITLPGDRYVLFIEYAGRPLTPEHLIYPLLAGLGRKCGVFYTSDIRDFDDVTRLILEARMRTTPGLRVEDLLMEDVPMPVIEMAADPQGTLAAVAGLGEPDPAPLDPDAPPQERPAHVPTAAARLIRMQLALAAVPVVLFVVDNLVTGNIPFLRPNTWGFLAGIVGLLVIGLLELPLVALAIQALGENLLGNGEFRVALDTYPYLEMPRVLGFMALLALIVVKAPFFLVFLAWLAILGYTAYLTLGFAERLYRIPRNQAVLAAGASALGQCLVLLAYMMLRAPAVG